MHRSVIYEFGPFRIDSDQQVLLRQGAPVELPPKAWQTLFVLVQNAGRIVSREELQKRVWPDTFTEPSNLAHQVLAVRKALGEGAASNSYIQTVPRRGYRFIAEVRTVEPEPAAGASETSASASRSGLVRSRVPRYALLAAFVLVLVVAAGYVLQKKWTTAADRGPIRSIAVLPLANISGDPQQEYLADSLTEAVTTELARFPSLRIISRSSAMHFKGSKATVPDIARQLGVDGIIEGSVLRSGERVRVSMQLIDARRDSHVWAESYDRDLRDLLSMESDLARDIADRVAVTPSVGRVAAAAASHAVDPQAQDAYLKGRFAWNQRTEQSYQAAIGFFEQALARDPTYAPAYAGLADAYALLGSVAARSISRGDAMEKARTAALRAIALDPNLAAAHASLAFVLMHYDWKFADAEKEFRLALRLNPSYATAHQWYAYDLVVLGRMEEALEENARAQRSDPLSLAIATDRGELLLYARRYPEAVRQLQGVLALDPNFYLAHAFLAIVYNAEGDHAAAAREAEKAIDLSGSGVWAELSKAETAARRGERATALRIARRIGASAQQFGAAYEMASLYDALGDQRRALEWLNRAAEDREGSMILLKVDPAWDQLRSLPQFTRLLRRVNLN